MKTLTIWEPWATLIAQGRKQIENRSWSTTHRGTLAIHAGRKVLWDVAEEYGVQDIVAPGFVLCTVQLVDVVDVSEVAQEPFATGPLCWILVDPRETQRVRIRGQMGLFDI